MTKAPKQPTRPEGARVSSWRGYTRYECTACPFDTLDPDTFADHWTGLHVPIGDPAEPAFEQAPPPVGETLAED